MIRKTLAIIPILTQVLFQQSVQGQQPMHWGARPKLTVYSKPLSSPLRPCPSPILNPLTSLAKSHA
jgi:hypothetical protein